jgi:hypothetical protein
MKPNIKEAIRKEQQFVYEKVYEKKDNAELIDYIKEAGYTNIEDFLKDKEQYIIKSIHLDIIKAPKINNKYKEDYVKNSIPALLYSIHTGEDYLFVTNDTEDYEAPGKLVKVNLGYQSENSLIVSPDGDLRIYVIIPIFAGIDTLWFLKKMKTYLENFFNNVEIVEKRYITIDGKIVIRSIYTEMHKMRCIMFNISFVDSTELHNLDLNFDRSNDGVIDSDILTAEEFKDEIVSWVN